MKVLKVTGRAGRFLLASLLVVSVVAAEPGSVSYQDKGSGRRIDGNELSIYPYTEIPEATEPCTPEECGWWKQIRNAGNELQKRADKNDKKLKARFLRLLREGRENGYRVPLKNRLPQSLSIGKLSAPDVGQNGKITGSLAFSVEFRADGSVGDIQMIRRLEPAIDDSVVRTIRECVFLPAIENRAFVTSWRTSGAEFVSHPRN